MFFGVQSLTYHDCTSLQTGASLKLTILNPKGRIWTMVAGGGASVIYADTVHVCLVLRELLQLLSFVLTLVSLLAPQMLGNSGVIHYLL